MVPFILVAVVVSIWVGLIALKNQTVNAWKQIDVQLKRRHDLIPNLVSTVKGSMEFEKETLQAVVDARSRAMSGGGGVKDTVAAEGALSGALGKLFVVMEQYPDLKSSQNVRDLQEELSSTENKIAFARQLYNDVATSYNTKQQQFPTNLVAGLATAQVAELWELEDQAERAVPQVDLSLKPKPQA
jgi:LemA protein